MLGQCLCACEQRVQQRVMCSSATEDIHGGVAGRVATFSLEQKVDATQAAGHVTSASSTMVNLHSMLKRRWRQTSSV